MARNRDRPNFRCPRLAVSSTTQVLPYSSKVGFVALVVCSAARPTGEALMVEAECAEPLTGRTCRCASFHELADQLVIPTRAIAGIEAAELSETVKSER